MRRQLRFRAEAFANIAEALSWYQQRRLGLGREFDLTPDLLEVRAIVHMHRDPARWRHRA